MIKLRGYQEEALFKVERASAKRILVVAPTGAGKGTMASALIARYARQKKRVIFMVHRREIIIDIEQRLAAYGIQTAQTLLSDRRVRVVSVQTAPRYALQPVDLLILDEAHHYAADVWRGIAEAIPAARVVGFTATPQRADGRPLGDMFDKLIDVISYSELLQKKFIVPCKVLRPPQILQRELAQDPVQAYLRYGEGRPCLIFTPRVGDAQDCRDQLLRHGVAAEYITTHTKKDVRDAAIQQLKNGTLQVIVNVGTLTEGVDVPYVSCIVLARPCAHASIYIQIAGRALRAAPGKTDALLIDLVGASHMHGLPGEDREHTLDGAGIGWKRDPNQVVEREPAERLPYDILDLHLEMVTLQTRPKLLPKPKIAPPPKPKSPKATANKRGNGPMPITPGFVFQDRTFWVLGWKEHGKPKRMGLGTKEQRQAEEYLAIFREAGPDAVRERVRRSKRKMATIWSHFTDNWRLRTWDPTKSYTEEYRLFTEEKAEAEYIKELFDTDQREAALDRIERNREKWPTILDKRQHRANAKRRTTVKQHWESLKQKQTAE